jgi:hypothetical protein
VVFSPELGIEIPGDPTTSATHFIAGRLGDKEGLVAQGGFLSMDRQWI